LDSSRNIEDAVRAYEKGEINKAVKILKDLFYKDPNSYEVLMNLANLEHTRGNLEEAKMYAERCLKLASSWEMHDIMFDFHYSKGQYREALKHIEHAVKLCEGEEKELLRKKKMELESELLRSLKVLHFSIDSPYICRYVEFLTENFGFMEHTFILDVGENLISHAHENFKFIIACDDPSLGDQPIPINVLTNFLYPSDIFHSGREIVREIRIPRDLEKRLHLLLNSCDIFIIHGFFGFSNRILIPFFYKNPDYLNKAVYIPWTGDYFDMYWYLKNLSNTGISLASKYGAHIVLFYMQRRIIKRISTIINLQGSLEEVCEVFNHNFKNAYLFSPYPIVTNFKLLDSLIDVKYKKDSRYILLGNSAHPYNRHVETLKVLRNVIGDGGFVICPLSYPPRSVEAVDKYVNNVIKQGKQLFGEKFIPLLKMIPRHNYARMLSYMDVGVFNSLRRQGFGNIIAMLYLGKKVYMAGTSLRKDLEALGIEVYPIGNVRRADFYEHDEKTAVANRQKVLEVFSETTLIENWRRFFVDMALKKR